uniref:Uncharacterized protein n=1 Tax=Mucochytrium quahogii TaxID=96639 RepID=A0A7S2SF20_9STRA|mmetsp:Transcript_7381/g.11809  ORF Transcript_7381/g.11809 Transcript_7381/m.11809 type:complete len:149 (+) Transcript_7381:198-644(+)
MSCPVGPERAKETSSNAHVLSDLRLDDACRARAESLLLRYNKLLPDCKWPLRRLNHCQYKVSTEQGGDDHCVKEANCYLACNRQHTQVIKSVYASCGDCLEGHRPSAEYRFAHCVKTSGDAQGCIVQLEKFIACAESNVETLLKNKTS